MAANSHAGLIEIDILMEEEPVARRSGQFSRQVNMAVGLSALFVLAAVVGLVYSALRRKVERQRKDPYSVIETIARAQKRFIYDDRDQNGKPQPAASIAELIQHRLLMDDFKDARFNGYRFEMVVNKDQTWVVRATPEKADGTHYLRNQYDYVYSAKGRAATNKDTVVSTPKQPRKIKR